MNDQSDDEHEASTTSSEVDLSALEEEQRAHDEANRARNRKMLEEIIAIAAAASPNERQMALVTLRSPPGTYPNPLRSIPNLTDQEMLDWGYPRPMVDEFRSNIAEGRDDLDIPDSLPFCVRVDDRPWSEQSDTTSTHQPLTSDTIANGRSSGESEIEDIGAEVVDSENTHEPAHTSGDEDDNIRTQGGSQE